jgi:hypothetical protein
METTEIYELPELIEISDFGGNFASFLNAVYQIFREDFVDSRPVFKGKRLQLKRYPLIDGKEYTFYHMTHEGNIELNRIPDFRRMERIAWPRPMIDDSEYPYLKVWRNTRRGKGGTKERILILHIEERYLVILDDRKDYILPWTAYLLRSKYEVAKKLKEYEDYIKAETASKN